MECKYVIWTTKQEPNCCVLKGLQGVEKQYQLQDGVSRIDGFTEAASFSMNPDFPNDMVLTDNLINIDMMKIISKRVKSFLEEYDVQKVEYLPVKIINHKGRVASHDYFILHDIDPVDCLDKEKCGVTLSPVDPDSIEHVERLVLDDRKVDPTRHIFRPKYFSEVTLVSRELASAIDRKRFTGIGWKELEDYPRPR